MSSAPNAEQKRRFHWTRFSLRRVFVVCAMLCGLLAWFGNVLYQVRREHAALAFLRSKGAEVFYKTDALPEGVGSYQRRLLKHLAGYGDSRPINQIGINRLDIDEAASVMAQLRHLPDLRELRLVFPQRMGTPLIPRNEVFQPLAGMSRLRRLDWVNAPVDDGVLRYIRELRHMRELRLSYSGVTDEGLRELREFRDLHTLYLDATSISDAGLAHLSSLHRLKHLTLYNTKVTPEGVRTLEQQLPGCKVSDNAREPVSADHL